MFPPCRSGKNGQRHPQAAGDFAAPQRIPCCYPSRHRAARPHWSREPASGIRRLSAQSRSASPTHREGQPCRTRKSIPPPHCRVCSRLPPRRSPAPGSAQSGAGSPPCRCQRRPPPGG